VDFTQIIPFIQRSALPAYPRLEWHHGVVIATTGGNILGGN